MNAGGEAVVGFGEMGSLLFERASGGKTWTNVRMQICVHSSLERHIEWH